MEPPKTPKGRQVKRTRNVTTPDRLKNPAPNESMSTVNRVAFNRRLTMASTSMMQMQSLVPKKHAGSTRQSILPSPHFSIEGQRRTELENNDNELSLLYDKYLQSLITNLIVKKRIEEKNLAIADQLATVARERDLAEEELAKVKLREKDIRNLSTVQNIIDSQFTEVDTLLDDLYKNYPLMEKLSEIQSVVEPLDRLRCKDVVIPKNVEELEEFGNILKETITTLKSIKKTIGDKGDTFQSVKTGLDDFTKKHSEIESALKKFEDVICSLQILALNKASHSISQNEN